jgi:hypothetical protein
MVVGPEERRLSAQFHAGLLSDLPRDCGSKVLVWIDATCGYLRAGLGMVSVFEDQELSFPLDVDDNSLTALHLQIVSTSVGARRLPANAYRSLIVWQQLRLSVELS